MPDRQKALRYRRAVFHEPADGTPGAEETLEDYLRQAHAARPTVPERRVTFDTGYVLEVRTFRLRRGVGHLLHLVAYTQAEPASVVPVAGAHDHEAPVGTAPPPRNADYMDGDLLALIAGNDVIICANSLHESKLESYCTGIFNNIDLPPIASMFSLRPVADADVIEVIENEGVKSISLDATAFVASGARAQRRSLRRTLSDGMRDVVTAMFGEDKDVQELYRQDNVSAEIVLKFDRRKTGGEIGQQKMEDLAKQLANEPDGGVVIRTLRNTRVGQGTLSLQKPVRIRADGKTVARDAAFAELVTYYQELRDAGHLTN